MIVIETCPECGADLYDVVLTSYPPKSGKQCMSCGWSYISDDTNDIVRIPFSPPEKKNIQRAVITTVTTDDFDDPCAGCSNHPRNGGSGICCCTVPYMSRKSPYTITC